MKMNADAKRFLLMDQMAQDFAKTDSRQAHKVIYPAALIMLAALMGVFAGHNTWNDIAMYANFHKEWLRHYIPNVTATPSHDTFRRFFCLLEFKHLENLYRSWASKISEEKKSSTTPRHIAIDGKEKRGAKAMSVLKSLVSLTEEIETNDDPKDSATSSNSTEKKDKAYVGFYFTSAYDVNANTSLGQVCIDKKSNEIPADKQLIEELAIGKNDLITIDAIGTQVDIVNAIRAKGADYLLTVKQNQSSLHKAIKSAVGDSIVKGMKRSFEEEYTEVDDKAHGFTVVRTCYLVKDAHRLGIRQGRWKDIKSFGMIKACRTNKKTGERIEDICYFISSLDCSAEEMLRHKRNHWGVENGLHRTLDVEFNEDDDRKRGISAFNFSLIRKMALTVLKNNGDKIPLSAKRKIANWSEEYMIKLMDAFIATYAN